MRQQQNSKKVGWRLEALKTHHSVTWGELAPIIGISRSMLDFVRSGVKEPGPKVMRRIAAAERAAGLLPPEPPPAPRTMAALKSLEETSKDWKTHEELFQSLETRLERLLLEAQAAIAEMKEMRGRKG